ncbi:hypothetical protein N9X87_00050 [bacterium]|nr:hypothetical protein [bacterium]
MARQSTTFRLSDAALVHLDAITETRDCSYSEAVEISLERYAAFLLNVGEAMLDIKAEGIEK